MNFDVIRALLHPPPWLLYTWLVVLLESVYGNHFGCLVKSPPGFECDARFALPMPVGLPSPFRLVAGYFLPAGLLFLLVKSLREAFDESLKVALDRFFGRIVHADPYALFGTRDQRGLRPPGWTPLPEGMQLGGLDEGEFRSQAEHACRLVNRAWAVQDPMAAREVVATQSWVALSGLIDESRRYRRAGILLNGLDISGGRVLRSGFLDAEEAVTARLDVECADPLTNSQQDWTFVRPRDGRWQMVAVEPVPDPKESRPSGEDGRLERS
jgi:hypothetical protein